MKVATVWLLALVVNDQVPWAVMVDGAGWPEIRLVELMTWAGAGKVRENVDSSSVVVSIT